MEDIIFKHDPHIEPEKFILKERHIIIVSRSGQIKDRSIRMVDIDPDYEQGKRRFAAVWFGPILLAGILGIVSWMLFAFAASWIAYTAAIFVAAIAAGCPLGMRFDPVEFARFRDTRGQPLFEVYRSRKSADKYYDEFDEFVRALVKRVRDVHQMKNEPPSSAPPPPR